MNYSNFKVLLVIGYVIFSAPTAIFDDKSFFYLDWIHQHIALHSEQYIQTKTLKPRYNESPYSEFREHNPAPILKIY